MTQFPLWDVLMYPCKKINKILYQYLCPLKTVQIIIGVVIFLIGILLSNNHRPPYSDIIVVSGITYWGSFIVSFISLFCCIASVFITCYIFSIYNVYHFLLFFLSTSLLDLCLFLRKISYVPVWCVMLKQ